MKTYQVLCIDDDEQFLTSLEDALPRKVEALCSGFACAFDFVTTPREAMEVLASAGERNMEPAMVISDQVMPGATGIDLIERAKKAFPDLACVLLTGHAGLESAKYAINQHLLDQYVSKPIDDLQEFALLIINLLRGHHACLEERERTVQLAITVEELRVSNERVKAMQSAAEQVAMLSKSLKVLDFDDVADVVINEVPRIFGAEWSVVCLPKNPCQQGETQRLNCPCPDAVLHERQDIVDAVCQGQPVFGPVALSCSNIGAQSPDVVVPLSITGPCEPGQTPCDPQAFLCMCQISPAMGNDAALLAYKAELVQEVLGANLANARLYQEARRQGQIDSLTGANTMRVVETAMDAEHERSVRYKHTFCVAMIDVDRFKDINDTHGHAAGDSMLTELAQMLKCQARATDVVARYGGDEFVILMPETTLDQGAIAAQRICDGARGILMPDGKPLNVCVGVAQWSGLESERSADVMRRADAALYATKRGGRNRTQVAA